MTSSMEQIYNKDIIKLFLVIKLISGQMSDFCRFWYRTYSKNNKDEPAHSLKLTKLTAWSLSHYC